MVEVKEEDVYKTLLKYRGQQSVDIAGAEISIALNPVDIHKVVFVKGKRCSRCLRFRKLDEFFNKKQVCMYCERRLRKMH